MGGASSRWWGGLEQRHTTSTGELRTTKLGRVGLATADILAAKSIPFTQNLGVYRRFSCCTIPPDLTFRALGHSSTPGNIGVASRGNG